MPSVVIDNPIINSPFREPTRHHRFSDDGITNEMVDGRRSSAYFIPIPRPRGRGRDRQLFETEWTQDRVQENAFINKVREKVNSWRAGRYQEVTSTTRALLDYWTHPERENRLFFCQIEALETAIYITELGKYDPWIENDLRKFNADANPDLYRMAFKMATGSGKTVVMGMLIAWQALNKLANPQDARFSDAFLIVSPGITIRDRLRVLLPNDPQNYYRERDIVPPSLVEQLGKAKILITNFHAFKPREKGDAGRLTKSILDPTGKGAFTEAPDQMVRRVCRELGTKHQIVVLNDEAHHCYRRKSEGEEVQLAGDERREAQKREEEARVWISGLEAVKAKLGVKVVYDLSATPFFLRGSGYPEGTLFPWVVSDFSLIDAIEAGIVKIPRVPVEDNSKQGESPTYRDLWLKIREDLPKKGRKTGDLGKVAPNPPMELEGALRSLYSNYELYYRAWERNAADRAKGQPPPVFIVVCNNTNVSKLVYDWVAGWEKEMPDGTKVLVPGNLGAFSNVEGTCWRQRPNSILVDSQQLESGEALSDDFKKIASVEIETFKAEYRARFPGRDADQLEDEDVLREVMNTVGKPGKLGEQVKCVVSVSMLTEGWDANTVTHILGVRAFGTQLLCEQVVGRGLRRRSYTPRPDGMFEPEYAEVYGVPFSFIPCSGSASDPKPGPTPTRVRALPERIQCEISFPRLVGYRWDLPGDRLKATFGKDSRMALTTADVPTKTQNAPIIGEKSIHTLDDLKAHREQEVAFLLAKLVLEKYFRQDGEVHKEKETKHRFQAEVQAWLFPQVLEIAKRWLAECVTCKDDTFPQLLLLTAHAHDAADKIYQAIVSSSEGEKVLKPILRPYDPKGSTCYVDFDTTRPVYPTHADKCHISHVVADTESWEQKMAEALEDMPEVVHYAKNHQLQFTIPYTLAGDERQYMPDFLVRLDDGRGKEDLLTLIVEVSGEARKDKAAKAATARNLWVPAVNNHGGFGRWAYLEITDPWDAQNTIRASLKQAKKEAVH